MNVKLIYVRPLGLITGNCNKIKFSDYYCTSFSYTICFEEF